MTIRLGKEPASDGSVARLVSEGQTQVFAHRSGGGRVCIGGTTKHSVFTRPDADPARRRVTELHPYMNLGKLPQREVRLLGVENVTAPPRDYRLAEEGRCEDREPHVWSYLHTDPNKHVHAMEYVRAFERFAADHLGPSRALAASLLLRSRPRRLSPSLLHRSISTSAAVRST